MISNVSNNSTTDLASTSNTPVNKSSDISIVNTCFGQVLVENIGGSAVDVGCVNGSNVSLPDGMTMDDLRALEAKLNLPLANETTPSATSTTTGASGSGTTTGTGGTTGAGGSSGTSGSGASGAGSTTSGSGGTTTGSGLIPGIAVTDPKAVVSAEQAFGDTPWITTAGGTGPTGDFNLNPEYFASQQTAQMVANMVGGTVVPVDVFALTPGNHFSQNTPNLMVQLADGKMINAGQVAGFFSHGYQLSMIQQMIQNEVANVESEPKEFSNT